MKKERLFLWMSCLLFLVTGAVGAEDFQEDSAGNLDVNLSLVEAYCDIPVHPIAEEDGEEMATLLGSAGWHMHSWISSDCEPGVSLGRTVPERVQIGDRIYLNYEILDEYNNDVNPRDYGYDYSVKETIYNTDGSVRHSYTYYNSPNNWISVTYGSGSETGLQRGNITLDGDLYCSSDLSWMLYDAKPSYSGISYTSKLHVGSAANFDVSVSGNHLSYQWYVASSYTADGEPISGAVSSQYSVTATVENSGKYYYCKISNYGNVIYSSRGSFQTYAYVSWNTGGYGSFSSSTVINGEKYGELPKPPTRDGYLFEGWYTSPKDGEKIEADTVAALSSDQTLYAHWIKQYLAEGWCGSNLRWTLTNDGALTVSGAGPMSNYSYSYNVPWYYYQSRITQLSIERGVTSIGNHAFCELPKLSSVNLPEGVTAIGEFAFEKSGIRTLFLPESLTKIEKGAFSSCSELTELTLPENLAEIGAEAFASCSGLTDLVMPDSVTNIGSKAFQGCSQLRTAVLPTGLASIPVSMFERCDALTDVTIPESVTSVEASAFNGCLDLQCIFYNGTLAQWGALIISDGNQPLKNATVTYTRILDSGECGAQASWILTEGGILHISGSGPIKDYSVQISDLDEDSLTGVLLSGDDYASLQSINGALTAIGSALDTALGVSAWDISASAWLPDIHHVVGSSWRNLDVPSSAPWYEYRDRVKIIIIGEDITKIGEYCFFDCHYLEKVVIPDGVLEIGAKAFYNCCYALEEISLPSSLRSLGEGVFQWCQKLKSVSLPDKISTVPDDLFYHCDALESVTLPTNATEIGNYAFEECVSLKQITIPSGVTSIGKRAFYKCDALETINVESGNSVYASVDGVLFNADKSVLLQFPAASSITNYAIPYDVERVRAYAFYHAESLLKLTIPYGVTALEEGAFSGCRRLDNLILPTSVAAIGKDAFADCEALRRLRIPDKIRIIENGTFRSCKALEEIVIPASAQFIGEGAFSEASKLADVYYLGTESQWSAISVESDNAPLNSATKHYVADAGYLYNRDDSFQWILDREGTLTVNGSGAMPGYYPKGNPAPWSGRVNDIRALKLSEGITAVGTESFPYCVNLETVTFPDSLTTIEDWAFGCSGLKSARFPANLTLIGVQAFYNCSKLTEAHYDGASTDWAKVTVQSGNEPLTDVLHFSRVVVRFDANGATVNEASRVVDNGGVLGDLPTPERRREYEFLGWYTDPDPEKGTQVTADTVVTQDITLYAHWKYLVVTVTLDANGGTVNDASSVSIKRIIGETYGDEYSGKFSDVSRGDNYQFLGWYTASSGGTQVTEDDIVTQDITLYAHWQLICKARFDANGGTVNGGSAYEVSIPSGGTLGTLPTPDDRSPEYQFLGWYTDPDPEKGTQVTADTVVTQDITLYAHWKYLVVTVKLDANGGRVNGYSSCIIQRIIGETYGDEYFGEFFDASRGNNDQFLGWYTASSGGTQVTEDDIVTRDITLYAHWQLRCAVRFNANGGTVKGASVYEVLIPSGETLGALPTPDDRGREYQFLGWYTSDEKLVTKDTVVMRDINLYAHWKYLVVTVKLNANGGTVNDASSVSIKRIIGETYGDEYSGKFSDASRGREYKFLGWYASDGTLVTKDTVVTQDITLHARWKDLVVTVMLDANGGRVNGYSSFPIKRIIGETYGYEYSGYQFSDASLGKKYEFLGWYTAKDGGTLVTKDTVVTQDTTLYAHWKYLVVTVKLDANGGTVNGYSSSSIQRIIGETYGDEYSGKFSDASRGNEYEFLGWYTDPEEGTQVTKDTVVTQDITLYAHWNQLPVKVTFNANGGTVNGGSAYEVSIPSGGTLGTLPTPDDRGREYKFLGWYASDEKLVTKDTVVTQNIIFYARWEYLVVTVKLDANGGVVNGYSSSSIQRIIGETYGDEYSGKFSDASRGNNYQFLGWYTASSGGTQVTEDDIVTQVITLYAHWQLICKAQFDANGGTVNGGSAYEVSIPSGGTLGTLPTPDDRSPEYQFLGWYTAKDGGTQVTEDTVVMRDINLYALWKYLVVTVTLDANGGTVSPTKHSAIIGKPYGHYGELPTPERNEYEFLGWYTDPKDGMQVIDASIVERATTLYAHWRTLDEIPVIVDFEYNGGGGDTFTKKVIYGKPYGMLPKASKEPLLFDYWYLKSADGNEIPVTEESIVEEKVNHFLYAHYSQPDVMIRFSLNGGTRGEDMGRKIRTYGDYYGNLPSKLSWEHHSFVGWFTEPEDGVQITSTTRVKQPEAQRDAQGEWGVLLYAHWVDNPKVTLDPKGGAMDACKAREVEYGKPFGEFLDYFIPKREASQFLGWYTGEQNGKRITSTTLVESYGEFTLYAHWRSLYQTVLFDPNGHGSVDESIRTVTNGKYYMPLPALITSSEANYQLDGWYTKPGEEDKGDKITASTLVDLDAQQTLYAHVKPKDKFTVTFDLNGVQASVSPKTISVENGKTYGASGDLPIPKGADRDFLGWHTSQQGGQQVIEQTVVQLGNHQTLYAHWGASGQFTVKLIPGENASVSPDTVTVENGKAYGALPTPTKDGFSFIGWYTAKDAGTLVTSATIFRLKENQTLYARWKDLSGFNPEKDGYSIGNSADAFRYQSLGPGEDSYPIPYRAFKLIFGDTVAGQTKYRSMIQSVWGGNCNGMASTAMLLFAAGYITPNDFGKDITFALNIDDLSDKIAPVADKNQATVKLFIEAMQIAQYTEPFSKDYKNNRLYQSQLDGNGSLDALFETVERACKQGRGTIIGVGNSTQRSAHALLAYKTEETESGDLRIYVYDCNYPGAVRYIQLTKNGGAIKDWSYEIGGRFGTWKSGKGSACYISYIPYETIDYIWTNRGNLYNNHVMLTVNSDNLSITTGFGEEKHVVAKVENGILTEAGNGVYDIPELSLTLNGQPSDKKGISLYLPVSEYTLLSDDDGELKATLTDNHLGATVATTASGVRFAVEDKSLTNGVTVLSDSEDDTFEIYLENGYGWAPSNTIDVDGKGAGADISIQALPNGSVSINGASDDLSVIVNGIIVPVPEQDPTPSELFSNADLDKSTGVASFTLNNSEGGTVMAMAYDEAKDMEFVGLSMKDVAANAGAVELRFTDTNFPETCKIKFVLLEEWPSWRILGSYEFVT